VNDGTGHAEALLGLPGFRVLEVAETAGEVVVRIETTAAIVGCGGCGVRAEAQDRVEVAIRDLPCFGRPARLVWRKRRWRCREPRCAVKTWTEASEHLDAQVVLTRRAGAEACRQVGELARPVSRVAEELGVCWWTVMNAVIEHGTPLVDDPARVGQVRQLGVDETSFLKANRRHRIVYATGMVDLQARVLIDMVEGHKGADLRRWAAKADPGWLAGIEVVATDLTKNYRAGLSPHLDHTRQVADPFHVVRAANRCLDKVRQRVQMDILGHRGRRADPLNRIRKLLLLGNERLDDRGRERLLLGLRVGDPNNEVHATWLAKENVRDIYLADTWRDARTLLDKAITACLADDIPELVALGNTLKEWRREILAHHTTGASNGPSEALNLCVKRVKRCGHGFRTFEHYRLRVLLHAGAVTWPDRPRPPRIRTRAPHSNA